MRSTPASGAAKGVFRHPLEPKGAGFKAGQEPFVMLPRPTDIDVDGQSRIFISSWRGADVYLRRPERRLRHPRDQPGRSHAPFPDLKAAADAQLVAYLASPSQVLRLAAQREILRRGNRPGFATESRGTGPCRRAAGAAGRGDLHARATAGPRVDRNAGEARPATRKVREFALHALADRKEDAARIPADPFVDGAGRRRIPGSGSRRSSASAGWARSRRPRRSSPRTADDDPLVAHVAVKALVALDARSACLAALDPATPKLAAGAARALQAMHNSQAVDGLIKARRISRRSHPPACVQGALPARPPRGRLHRRLVDHAARYQRPVLQAGRLGADQEDRAGPGRLPSSGPTRTSASELLVELVRNKVELEGAAGSRTRPGRPRALGPRRGDRHPDRPARSLPARDGRFLEGVARSDKETPALRAKVLNGLVRHHRRSATARAGGDRAAEMLRTGTARRVEGLRPRRRATRGASATSGDWPRTKTRRVASWRYAVLLALDANPEGAGAGERPRPSGRSSRHGRTPRVAASLLRAIGRTDSVKYAFQVRNRLKDEHPRSEGGGGVRRGRAGPRPRDRPVRTAGRRSRRSLSSRCSPRR